MALKPWREVIVPHKDVLEERHAQADYAADLNKVAMGKADPEYQEPVRFFERTVITEGTRLLLNSVLRRLAGKGGEPVIQLRTSFGGGKTHTLLTVYHAAGSKVGAKNLAGMEKVVKDAGLTDLPKAKVAVLDCNAFSPSEPRDRAGIKVHTLWGELAWQIGGAKGYAMLEHADKEGTSPGKEILANLLEAAGPTAILLDETVLYFRQFEPGKSYAGGTFDSNLSFIQALTEAVGTVSTAVMLASLPQSDMELGDVRGKQALDAIEKVFGRKEAVWKPVGTEEGFEIVRRRLFSQVVDEASRDAACNAFAELYFTNKDKFPTEASEAAYLDRLKKCYPVHPEFFSRLYEDWAGLDKFQKTRGVLSLMAKVIFRLWQDNNRDPIIFPGVLPLHDPQIANELVRYLPSGWEQVIDKDVDGPKAIPTQLDNQNALFGTHQYCRRVSRTLFLGSAPAGQSQRVRGLTSKSILLGCAEPDISLGRVDDALKHLNDQLYHLYAANDRFWFDIRWNLRREAEDRKSRFKREEHLIPELRERVRQLLGRGDIGAVQVFSASEDIQDDETLRLVVLAPTGPHRSKVKESRATQAATEILQKRGAQPRQNANRLIYLAFDEDAVSHTWEQCRQYLAWKQVEEEKDALNLDQHQSKEAHQRKEEAEARLKGSILESLRWVLAPIQEAKSGGGLQAVTFEERSVSLTGGSSPTSAIAEILKKNEIVIWEWNPFFLKETLQKYYFNEQKRELSLEGLWQDFCRYAYLPRLKDRDVLAHCVTVGLPSTDFFGYASGKKGDKFEGLVFGEAGHAMVDSASLLLATGLAAEEKASLQPLVSSPQSGAPTPTAGVSASAGSPSTPGAPGASDPLNRRFFASVKIGQPLLARNEVQRIVEEVVQHLHAQPDALVELSLEINAQAPRGYSKDVERTIKENSKTLRFGAAEFEKE